MIPNDPFMLYSYINTQLRDNYKDIDEMCNSLDINKMELESKLKSIGYTYDESTNQFR